MSDVAHIEQLIADAIAFGPVDGAKSTRCAAQAVEAVKALSAEVEKWKRMYECAQNANSYRQSALGE